MGDCLLRRRKKDTIPYTTVDYIQFDGTANSTFNTQIDNTLDNQVIVTFDAEGNNNCGIYELYAATDSNQKNKLIATTGTSYQGSDGTAGKTFTGSHSGKHTFMWNINDEAQFDNTTVIESPLKTSTAATKPYILGRAHTTVGSQYYCKGKIYNFAIKNINTNRYIMDLIPVQYDDSGTIKYGFYDKVSKTLKTATGWTGGDDT